MQPTTVTKRQHGHFNTTTTTTTKNNKTTRRTSFLAIVTFDVAIVLFFSLLFSYSSSLSYFLPFPFSLIFSLMRSQERFSVFKKDQIQTKKDNSIFDNYLQERKSIYKYLCKTTTTTTHTCIYAICASVEYARAGARSLLFSSVQNIRFERYKISN